MNHPQHVKRKRHSDEDTTSQHMDTNDIEENEFMDDYDSTMDVTQTDDLFSTFATPLTTGRDIALIGPFRYTRSIAEALLDAVEEATTITSHVELCKSHTPTTSIHIDTASTNHMDDAIFDLLRQRLTGEPAWSSSTVEWHGLSRRHVHLYDQIPSIASNAISSLDHVVLVLPVPLVQSQRDYEHVWMHPALHTAVRHMAVQDCVHQRVSLLVLEVSDSLATTFPTYDHDFSIPHDIQTRRPYIVTWNVTLPLDMSVAHALWKRALLGALMYDTTHCQPAHPLLFAPNKIL
jgi:hypothetical protein